VRYVRYVDGQSSSPLPWAVSAQTIFDTTILRSETQDNREIQYIKNQVHPE
jgi:hypothetical protein